MPVGCQNPIRICSAHALDVVLQIIVLVPVVAWGIGALAGMWGSGALAVTAFRAWRGTPPATQTLPPAPAG